MSNVNYRPNQFSRAFFLVGGLTATTLLGSYYIRLQHKKRQQAAGENPIYEQTMGRMAQKPRPGEDLEDIQWKYSQTPPAFPGDDHHSGHALRAKGWKQQSSNEGVMYSQPTPQRGRNDGSGKPYTKSPNYADNYGKTKRPTPPSRAGGIDEETGVPIPATAPA